MNRWVSRLVLLLLALGVVLALMSMARRLEELARSAQRPRAAVATPTPEAGAAGAGAVRAWPTPPAAPPPVAAAAVPPPSASATATNAAGPPLPPGAIPGEYVLSFYNERDREAFEALARKYGATVLGRLAFGNTLRLRVPSREALDALLREGPVPVDMGPNVLVQVPPPVAGKDPRAPEGSYLGFGNAAVDWLGAPGDVSGWGRGLRVAVLDGLVGSNPSLDGARITRVDLAAGGVASEHGTAVASLIAGQTADVPGLSPAADVISYGVMGANGKGDLFTLASAIVDAVDRGCRVINMSLCSPGTTYLLEQAVDYARQKGVILVAATGNDGVEGVMYPAALDGVLAVGAVDGTGRQVYFSNRGEQVDLVAPGVGVNAAGADNTVAAFSGTSASAPFVAAAVAALLSQNPDLSGDEAVAILLANADDHGAPGRDDEYGQGILDLARVENRDTAGIVDIAMGDPWLDTGGASPGLLLYVQNRGTVPVAAVSLAVDIDGVPMSAAFYNVGVGQTASRRFALDTANLKKYGQITVTCRATPEGLTDMVPGNNARQGVVKLAK